MRKEKIIESVKFSKQLQRTNQLKVYGESANRMLSLFKALANPVRLMIFYELLDGEKNVTTLTANLKIEQPSISRHLKAMTDAKMLKRRQQKNEAYYFINYKIIDSVVREFVELYEEKEVRVN